MSDEAPQTEAPGRSYPWLEALLVIAVVALGGWLRHRAAVETFPVSMLGDERYYAKLANTIEAGNGHYYTGRGGPAHAWRPPAWAWVLSTAVDRSLKDPEYRWPLVRLQLVLGTAVVLATWFLGRALFGARAGLLAALAAALSPTLIAFSHYMWSEMLFALLLTTGLGLIALQPRRQSWFIALAAGVVLGLATLTRELALGVAAVGAFWWLVTAEPGRRLRAVLLGGTMMLALVAVVAPWSLRNQRVLGEFVPVATVGWFATAEGNTLDADDWLHGVSPDEEAFREEYFAIKKELKRARFAEEYARERIAAEQPTWIFKKFVRSTSMLLEPDSFLIRKLRRDCYVDPDPVRMRLVIRTSLAFYFAALVLGAAGLAVAGGSRERWLAWLVLGAVLAVHVLANASTRFRVPWWPLIFAYAAQLLLHPGVLFAGRRWRWILAIVVVLVLASLRAPEFFAGLEELYERHPVPSAG